MGMAVFVLNLRQVVLMVAFMALYLVIQAMYRRMLIYLTATVTLLLLEVLFVQMTSGLTASMHFIVILSLRFMPVMMGISSLAGLPAGKVIAALSRLRLPLAIVIPLTVSFRFMPILKQEYAAIQVSARLRRVSVTSPRNWLRPLRTFEYNMVPLLMRSLKISDELSAAATVKGIDHPGLKTSIHQFALNWRDVGILLIYLIWLFAVYSYGG